MTAATFRNRVSITIADGIADVRMTRADKRNALDNDMFAGLAEAGEWLKTAPGARVAVLSGEGASFCAGLDFSSFQGMASGEGVGGGGDRPNRAVTDVADGAITAGLMRRTVLG